MKKILCFISDEFADFEITLALHKVKNVGKRDVITVGYNSESVISESYLRYKPDIIIHEAITFDDTWCNRPIST
jgi:hypothetical protein